MSTVDKMYMLKIMTYIWNFIAMRADTGLLKYRLNIMFIITFGSILLKAWLADDRSGLLILPPGAMESLIAPADGKVGLGFTGFWATYK